MQALIQVKNLSKAYKGKLALNSLSFDLYKGQIALLMGPNGAGKSTLARLLLGIESPTSGSINREKGISFGYLPQRFSLNTSISMTALSVIKMVCRKDEIDEDLLCMLSIGDIANRQIADLSGGQMQKVLIAANVLSKPNFLVLDEPMNGLDVESQGELHKLIAFLKGKFNMAILLISHDLNTIVSYADQVLCLNQTLLCHSKALHSSEDASQVSVYHHEH